MQVIADPRDTSYLLATASGIEFLNVENCLYRTNVGSFFKLFLSTAAREISLIKINALSRNSSNSPPLVLES